MAPYLFKDSSRGPTSIRSPFLHSLFAPAAYQSRAVPYAATGAASAGPVPAAKVLQTQTQQYSGLRGMQDPRPLASCVLLGVAQTRGIVATEVS
eukprot:scaffold164848_cov31-Tisochrysis_lutea.AAC.2